MGGWGGLELLQTDENLVLKPELTPVKTARTFQISKCNGSSAVLTEVEKLARN